MLPNPFLSKISHISRTLAFKPLSEIKCSFSSQNTLEGSNSAGTEEKITLARRGDNNFFSQLSAAERLCPKPRNIT